MIVVKIHSVGFKPSVAIVKVIIWHSVAIGVSRQWFGVCCQLIRRELPNGWACVANWFIIHWWMWLCWLASVQEFDLCEIIVWIRIISVVVHVIDVVMSLYMFVCNTCSLYVVSLFWKSLEQVMLVFASLTH